MQAVPFMNQIDGEWTEKEATVVQCGEPVQRQCEC
jgi:hypothetical protein